MGRFFMPKKIKSPHTFGLRAFSLLITQLIQSLGPHHQILWDELVHH